jgi:hypothetical protein
VPPSPGTPPPPAPAALSPQFEKKARQEKVRRHQGETAKGREVDATPDLLLKYPDAILTTYKRRQMKHLKYVFGTLAKTHEKHLKTLGTDACNILYKPLQRMQHPDLLLQHPCETLATYF